MNDWPPVGIGEDAKRVEIAGPVREGPRQTHGQEPRIGTLTPMCGLASPSMVGRSSSMSPPHGPLGSGVSGPKG